MTITVHKDSHCDHNLSQAQFDYVLKEFVASTEYDPEHPKVITKSITLPPEFGYVPCALHGPIMGQAPVKDDEVVLGYRGSRRWPSRLVDRPVQMVPMVTIIVGPYDGEPLVLYTMYGGPPAPREVGDPNLTGQDIDESRKFWAEHALARDLTRTA